MISLSFKVDVFMYLQQEFNAIDHLNGKFTFCKHFKQPKVALLARQIQKMFLEECGADPDPPLLSATKRMQISLLFTQI